MSTRRIGTPILLLVTSAFAGAATPREQQWLAPQAWAAPAGHMVISRNGRHEVAEVRQGLVVVDGDVVLGTADEFAQRQVTRPDQWPRAKAPAAQSALGTKGLAVAYPLQIWPASPGPAAKVPYVVTNGSTAVTDAIAEFNATFAGVIQWAPRVAEADYVEFALNGSDHSGACFSAVGRSGGKQQVAGSIDCNKATLLHQLAQVVGLHHEHQRPDAGTHVTYIKQNADRPLAFGKFGPLSVNADPIGLYDFGSIMHYGRLEFTKNNRSVLETQPEGIPIGEATTYSAGDIDQVKRLYGFAPVSVTVTTHPTGLPFNVDGTDYTLTTTFPWALGSQHTISTPSGVYQARADDTARYLFANWNDAGASSHQVTVTAGSSERTEPVDRPAVTVYQAAYQRYDEVDVAAFGDGTIEFDPVLTPISGTNYALDGSVPRVTGTPGAGNVFYSWSGDDYPPQGKNPRPWRIGKSPFEIFGQFIPTEPIYTIGLLFANPEPPTSPAKPVLIGTVDGIPTFLPKNYAASLNPTWTPGSTHTVAVADPTTTPDTTNVQWDWGSWSDGGAASHTLAALPGTSNDYIALFRPFYSGQVMSAPECGGMTSANPTATFYGYESGVTFSAQPSVGWFFTGWSDAVEGQPNPANLSVRDQFAVIGSYNLVAEPFAITSFSPANATAGTSNVPLGINGTGFTAGTMIFIKNTPHASTFVNSTHIDTTLSAVDLNTAGGISVIATNDDEVDCAVSVEATFTVKSAPPNKIFGDGFETPTP